MTLRLEPIEPDPADPVEAAPAPARQLPAELADAFWSSYPPQQAAPDRRPPPYGLTGPPLIHRPHFSDSQFGPGPAPRTDSESLRPLSRPAPERPAGERPRLVLAWPYQLPAEQLFDEKGNYAPLDGCVSPVRIFLRFSAPAVPLGSLRTPAWQWEPAVAGSWEWIDPLTLAFCATEEFRRNQPYQLSISGAVVRLQRGEVALDFAVGPA